MFLKKKNRFFSKIPVSIRVTGLYTIVIASLAFFGLSTAILLEDKYINQQSTEELVEAVEEIYENPDKFENFDEALLHATRAAMNAKKASSAPTPTAIAAGQLIRAALLRTTSNTWSETSSV